MDILKKLSTGYPQVQKKIAFLIRGQGTPGRIGNTGFLLLTQYAIMLSWSGHKNESICIMNTYATTTCDYSNALHWDKSTDSLLPMDHTDAHGISFAFQHVVCITQNQATTTPTAVIDYLSGFFLFLTLLIVFSIFIQATIFGLKTRSKISNTILGNNSQEGKKTYND